MSRLPSSCSGTNCAKSCSIRSLTFLGGSFFLPCSRVSKASFTDSAFFGGTGNCSEYPPLPVAPEGLPFSSWPILTSSSPRCFLHVSHAVCSSSFKREHFRALFSDLLIVGRAAITSKADSFSISSASSVVPPFLPAPARFLHGALLDRGRS